MNQSQLRRYVSQVLPCSYRLLYRPFSPTCRRYPVNPLRDRTRYLELEKFFAELNLFCGQCVYDTLTLKSSIRSKIDALTLFETQIRDDEDCLLRNEQAVLSKMYASDCSVSNSFIGLQTYSRKLGQHFERLLAEIEYEAFYLSTHLQAAYIVAMVDLSCYNVDYRYHAVKPDISPCGAYSDGLSQILTNDCVIDAARRLVRFPGLPDADIGSLYAGLIRRHYEPALCSVVDLELIKSQFRAAANAGVPVVLPRLLSREFRYITELIQNNCYAFERLKLSEIHAKTIPSSAVAVLYRATRIPQLSATVDQVVLYVRQIALKFEETNLRSDRQANLLQFEADFEDTDMAEARKISMLRERCKALSSQINTQREKRKSDYQFYAELAQFQLLNSCQEQLDDSIYGLARRIGINCPSGTAEMLLHTVKLVDSHVAALLAEYQAFDGNTRRKARIKWIEAMKQREIKQRLARQMVSAEKLVETAYKVLPHRPVMSRSHLRPKTQTGEAQRRERSFYAEAEFVDGGAFFK